MKRITLYVPETLNDGSPVPTDILESYEDEMCDVAFQARLATGIGDEGCTVSENNTGVWRSPSGQKYRERVRLLWVDVADAGPLRDLVLRLAHRIRVELAQEAVYLTIAPAGDAMTVTEYMRA